VRECRSKGKLGEINGDSEAEKLRCRWCWGIKSFF
jgi:hypothetical protein